MPAVLTERSKYAGGPASQKLGAGGTRNPALTLIAPLTVVVGLDATRRFLMLRTQLEASCATRVTARSIDRARLITDGRDTGRSEATWQVASPTIA